MTRNYDEPRPGRAKILVDERSLLEFLGLPDGMRVLAMHATNDPAAVYVIVESEDLPEVPMNAESPIVQVRWTVGKNEHDADVRTFEYVWPEGSAL